MDLIFKMFKNTCDLQGSAKVPGHLDFEALIGRFSTFLIMILNLHVNTFILAYCEPKLTKNYNSAISIYVAQSLKIGLERPKIHQNDPKNMQIVDYR